MPRELTSARVLVTGASSGVGLAAARAFARAGADVAVLARGIEGLEKAAEMVRGHGGRTLVLRADVADAEQVDAAVQQVVGEWGGLDVAVVNAAGPVFGPFTEIEPRDFERAVQVTFLGAVNTIRSSLPVLQRTAGTIVVTGSLMTRAPLPTYSSYAASKHALRGFVNSLRPELRAQGIRVPISMVNPGSIATPFWRHGNSGIATRPRFPPEGYTAAAVADALVAVAREPRAELTVGAEGKIIELICRTPKLGDLLLAFVYR